MTTPEPFTDEQHAAIYEVWRAHVLATADEARDDNEMEVAA